jgi:hypothetical protein
MVNNNEDALSLEHEEIISRRALAKKAAYVAPAVLAVVAVSQRPALAKSDKDPKQGGNGQGQDGQGGQGQNGQGG